MLLGEVACGSNSLSQSRFIASQVDWRTYQANHRDEWLACLRHTFQGIDAENVSVPHSTINITAIHAYRPAWSSEQVGRINSEQLVTLLKDKLPEEEVNLAVQEILMDAAISPDGLDFDDFVRLVREESSDSLMDLYDAR